jgi:hypothetical protein
MDEATRTAFGIDMYNLLIKYAFCKVGIGTTSLARIVTAVWEEGCALAIGDGASRCAHLLWPQLWRQIVSPRQELYCRQFVGRIAHCRPVLFLARRECANRCRNQDAVSQHDFLLVPRGFCTLECQASGGRRALFKGRETRRVADIARQFCCCCCWYSESQVSRL